jgi:hypothetical protein
MASCPGPGLLVTAYLACGQQGCGGANEDIRCRSVQKQCVNFDKLTDWRLANTIDMDRYVEVMRKPEGVTERKMADQYYAYYGFPNPNHPDGAFPDEDFNV